MKRIGQTMRIIPLTTSLLIGLMGLSGASAGTIQDKALQTNPGKEVRLGAYAVFRPDCSGGVAAQVRPTGDQHGGVVAISSGTLATTRVPKCGRVESPAQIITYRANPNFTGTDTVTYEVVSAASGQSQTHMVSISVAP